MKKTNKQQEYEDNLISRLINVYMGMIVIINKLIL